MSLGSGLRQYSGYNIASDVAHGNGSTAWQDMSKNDVVGNALGLPHFGDARSYTPQLPGAAQGPPPPGAKLQPGPNGTMVDPVTGQVYAQGPNGLTAVQNPNVAQQIGANLNRAAGFYGQAGGYDAREAGAYGQEASLADRLNMIASGSGPSIAGNQLAMGEDEAARAQMAQAAGASGNNAALARMSAMGNTAQLQAATNQQQAAARTAEQTNALNQLAGVTNNMQNQSMAESGQKISAADALNNAALGTSWEREKKQSDIDAANAKSAQEHKDGILGTFGKAVMSYI